MTRYSLRPQVVVSSGEDGPCVCDCEDGLIHTPVSSAIISIPPTPLGLGYEIIIMSSCYSSSAPCIIIHASLSIHPFALQPRSYQPSPHIPHHTHTTINYIFGVMTNYSLRPQVIVSAGEDGPCVCDCEDGLIHNPVSCAIISIPPTPLGLGYDIIIMSSSYSSSAPCIIIHASLSIHPFALEPHSYQPSPHIPHHTHTTINYIFGMMTSYSLRPQVVV
jgi:hypothetical protein